jgi:putative proteasome-type protease
LVYDVDSFSCQELACIDESNPYFAMVREAWGQKLQAAFEAIENPDWNSPVVPHPLRVRSARYEVLQKISSPGSQATGPRSR